MTNHLYSVPALPAGLYDHIRETTGGHELAADVYDDMHGYIGELQTQWERQRRPCRECGEKLARLEHNGKLSVVCLNSDCRLETFIFPADRYAELDLNIYSSAAPGRAYVIEARIRPDWLEGEPTMFSKRDMTDWTIVNHFGRPLPVPMAYLIGDDATTDVKDTANNLDDWYEVRVRDITDNNVLAHHPGKSHEQWQREVDSADSVMAEREREYHHQLDQLEAEREEQQWIEENPDYINDLDEVADENPNLPMGGGNMDSAQWQEFERRAREIYYGFQRAEVHSGEAITLLRDMFDFEPLSELCQEPILLKRFTYLIVVRFDDGSCKVTISHGEHGLLSRVYYRRDGQRVLDRLQRIFDCVEWTMKQGGTEYGRTWAHFRYDLPVSSADENPNLPMGGGDMDTPYWTLYRAPALPAAAFDLVPEEYYGFIAAYYPDWHETAGKLQTIWEQREQTALPLDPVSTR